jgi:hypothetical protein
MAAGIYDIVIEQGATFSKQLVLKNADNSPRDLTGLDLVRGQIRKSYTDSTFYAFAFSVTDNEITWTMPAETTATIASTQANTFYVYDVELVFLGGTVERLLQGKARVSPEVTK